MPGPALIGLHVLLLCLGAFLVGMRVYRETHPKVGQDDDDSRQARRVATVATVALFLLMVLLIVQADLDMFRVAEQIR
jgi:hypothetical protein